MKLPSVADRTVLITGCSTGIGRACCHLLREAGWRVFAAARKPTDLSALGHEGFETVRMDVADPVSVESGAADVIDRAGGTLGALVNNAGFGHAGAVEDLTRDDLRSQFEVNVFGLQDLTNRVLPAMIRAGCGRIVHVSSVLGRLSLPMLGAYCASKHAVEALADAQRIELRRTGVGLILVEPGPIETAFRRSAARIMETHLPAHSAFAGFYRNEAARRLEDDARRNFMKPPEAVARTILRALESERPRARYTVTLPAAVGPAIRAMVPDGCFDALMGARLPERSRG